MLKRLHDYWRQIFNLCHKEFLVIFKDPANRVILIAPALIQCLLFGYGATYDLKDVPYAVLDQSRAAMSTQLLAKLDGTGSFHRIANLQNPQQGAELIDDGKALLVLHIPADFESKLAAGQNAPVQAIVDGRNSTTAGNALSQFGSVVGEFNAALPQAQTAPLTVQSRVWFNPNQESRWTIMPALIASLSMMQVIMLAALSVAREREQGTFDQLLVTPATPVQIMLGKAVPSVAVGLMQSTLIFLLIRFWFNVPFAGSLLTLYGCLTLFNITVVGVGLSISALSLNMQQAMLYTFVLIMPMTLLSGLATPVENMPEILQTATYANPLRFAIDMVRRIYLEGASLADISHNFLPLACIAALSMPLAAWLFRNRLN